MDKSDKRENILDIMSEAERIGPGDKSHLEARIENMNRQIAERPRGDTMIEPLGAEEIAASQQIERQEQEEAASRGERYSPSGTSPRVSDFYLIDTTMEPEQFLKLVNDEVLGNYDVQEHQGQAQFGMIVLRHDQGAARTGTLSHGGQTGTEMTTLRTKPMILAKLDMGPWQNYDQVSVAILSQIVNRVGRRAWRCGWAVDKQWSWVEHWRQGKGAHGAKLTETIDGPANATVTAKARERWGLDVRMAFDDLMRAVQWEALRQWLVLPEPRPTPFAAHVSFTAGKLLIQEKDRDWIEPKWAELFPGRNPQDGALHLQAYYEMPSGRAQSLRGPSPANQIGQDQAEKKP